MEIYESRDRYTFRNLTPKFSEDYIKALRKTDLVDNTISDNFIQDVICNAELILTVWDNKEIISAVTFFYRSPRVLFGADFFCLLVDLKEKSKIYNSILEIMYTLAITKKIDWFCTFGRNDDISEFYRATGFFDFNREELILPLFILVKTVRQTGHDFTLPVNTINKGTDIIYVFPWGELRWRLDKGTVDFRKPADRDTWQFLTTYEYLPALQTGTDKTAGTIHWGKLDYSCQIKPLSGHLEFGMNKTVLKSPYWSHTCFENCFLPIHDSDPCEVRESDNHLFIHWEKINDSTMKEHELQIDYTNTQESKFLFSCAESVFLRLYFVFSEQPVILEKGFFVDNFYFRFTQPLYQHKILKKQNTFNLFLFFRSPEVELLIREVE